ncbi:hypothetical protein MMC26_001510 [Xylographa opegraphella]|nr:hypothetical protein [Xylographa opegraphella]
MSFTPALASDIDWTTLDLTVRDLGNGHIESRYSPQTGIWSVPKLINDPYLRVHGLAPALNYGQQAFEGLKAHRSPADEILLFRPGKHASRMRHSVSVVSIPDIPEAHFLLCVRLAVSLNAAFVPPHRSGGALYVRPVVFGSSGHLGLNPPTEYTFCVYVHPFSSYHGAAPIDALVLEDFDRAAPRGTGNAKLGGNYAPVMRWAARARADGFPITLHLDSQTRAQIDEFSTSGFLGVMKADDGAVTLVLPDSDNVIKSITSDSCVAIAKSLGWKVEMRAIPYTSLPLFAEVFAAGTAAALVPIRSITCRSHDQTFTYPATGATGGPCFQQLYDCLKGVQAGRLPDTYGWCDTVKAPSAYVSDIKTVLGGREVEGAVKAEKAKGAAKEKERGFGKQSYVLGVLSLLVVGLPWAKAWLGGMGSFGTV